MTVDRLFVLLALTGLVGAGWGCASVAAPEETPIPNPAQPTWAASALLEHLRFFNQGEVNNRGTGTVGYATAAAYVAARMEEFRLQPVLGSSFRVVYQTSLNYPLGAFLSLATPADTAAFWAGIDFLPDGRSDSGRVAAERVTLDPTGRPDTAPAVPVVMVDAANATTPYLTALARRGGQAALLVGRLAPRQATTPVEGLVVVRILPETAARILDVSTGRLDGLLKGAQPQPRSLQHTLQLHVVADHQPMAGALNLIGFQPGKHPRLASDLVIVCADLDAIGAIGGVGVFDSQHLGTGAAAVLEVARLYSTFARYWPLPERSILFAIWSGAQIGQAGLKAYLRHPPWMLERTRGVIYAGLAPEDEPVVRDLLAAHGLPLYVVSDPMHAEESPVVFVPPDDVPRRARTAATRSGADAANRTQLLQRAVPAAQTMADSINVLLLREAISPDGVMPMREQQLRVPDEASTNEQRRP